MRTDRALLRRFKAIPASLLMIAAALSFPAPPGVAGQDDGVDITRIGYDQGSEEAPLRVVEFSDFGCVYCQEFHTEIYPVLKAEYVDTGKIAWKFITVALGNYPHSEEAALVAECAADQGRFFEIRERLFEGQADWKNTADPTEFFRTYALEEGLDPGTYAECVAAGTHRLTLLSNTQVATRDLGLRSTPTFLILGTEMRSLPGSVPLNLFREALDQALAEIGTGGGP